MNPDLRRFFLHVLEAAGGGAVVLATIQAFGTKWIDRHFEQKLQAFRARSDAELASFKAQHDSELSQLRQKHETDLALMNHRLTSRISRIHEKEFEVLPEAWLKINEAQGTVHMAISAFKQRPNVQILPPAQFEELLSKLELTPFQVQDINSKTGDAKQHALDKALSHKEIDTAREKQRLLQNYLIQNRIFMTKDLQGKFEEINANLRQAMSNYEIGGDHDDRGLTREAHDLISSAGLKLPALELAIQQRIHYPEA